MKRWSVQLIMLFKAQPEDGPKTGPKHVAGIII